MFEKLVVDLINRALGDYVENLDASQLNLSIWRGDVRLENLNIKPNALEGLEIPIEVKQGHLGRLVLKIPWKNLYTEPTVAEIDGLYILAVPIFGMKFDPEKERQFDFEAKMKKVRQYEDNRARAALAANTKETVDLGFAEKMALQVIKNLQVKVRNVHIRYEDRVTCPDYPFTTGVCLESFSFQTTTAEWRPTTVRENVTQLFHKLLDLKCLSVYYNSLANMTAAALKEDFYSEISVNEHDRMRVKLMLEEKMSQVFSNRKPNLQYIIKPISARARFRYEAFPEQSGYVRPQIWLDLDFNELSLQFSKSQYTTLVVFGDSIDRIVTMNKYRKYRIKPGTDRLTATEKWRFAYKVVCSEVVRRRRNMWSWERMKSHRAACRAYTKLCKKRLKKEKYDSAALERYEMELDGFNIILCRQLAEGLVRKEKYSKKKKDSPGGKSGGWFSGWFGGSSKEESAQAGQSDSIIDSVRAEFERMSPEERAQLYTVVNYKEDAPQLSSFPRNYEARSMKFNLGGLNFLLHDGGQQVLKFQLQGVTANLGQYPSSDCLKVQAFISSVSLWGAGAAGSAPCMIRTLVQQQQQRDVQPFTVGRSSIESASSSDDTGDRLFQLNFDMNPFDATDNAQTASSSSPSSATATSEEQSSEARIVNNRIRLVANPVEIIYDAETVIKIVDFLEPSEEIRFRELSAVLSNQLESVKGMTATGLKHMIEQRTYTDISVDLKPSHLILSETGRYQPSEGSTKRLLVFDLGELSIRTEPPPDVSLLDATVSTESRVLDFEKMKHIAYDCLRVRLSSMQLLFADRGDDWRQFRKQAAGSPNHLLKPLALEFDLYKCMVTTDPRLPKVKIVGQLPSLMLELSESRARQLIELFNGIQFPKPTSKQLHSDVVDTAAAATATTSSSTSGSSPSDRSSKVRDVLDPKYRPSDTLGISVAADSDDDDDDDFEDAVETQSIGSGSGVAPQSGSESRRQVQAQGTKKKVFNLVDVEMQFEICSASVSLTKAVGAAQFLEFRATYLSLRLIKRTFDLRVRFCLDSVALLHHEFRDLHCPDKPLEILASELSNDPRGSVGSRSSSLGSKSFSSKQFEDQGSHLVQLKYTNVERNSPFLASEFGNMLQAMDVELQTVKVKMHKESLLAILQFAQTLLPLIESMTENSARQEPVSVARGQVSGRPVVLPSQKRLNQSSSGVTKSVAAPGPGSGSDLIDLQCNVRCAAVQLFVCQTDKEIMRANVRGLSAGAKMTRQATSLDVVLQKFEVTTSLCGSLYDTVIWVSQKQVFELNLTVFSLPKPAALMDSECVDMAVKAKLAKINCVFLHSFVVQMLHFFDSFQAAKAQIAEGAQKLTQSAKEKAVESSNLKMQLDVEIQAPVVLIPQSSQSENVLWADLGCIRVYNSFKRAESVDQAMMSGKKPLPVSRESVRFLDQWNAGLVASSAVPSTATEKPTDDGGVDMEDMQIELFDVKVLRSTVSKGANGQLTGTNEVQVMEPFELKAQLRRHYSRQPVDLPSLSIDGAIRRIDLRLAKADYHAVVGIFVRNLDEGQRVQSQLMAADAAAATVAPQGIGAVAVERQKATSKKLPSSQLPYKPVTTAATVAADASATSSSSDNSKSASAPTCAVQFQFRIEAISLELYNDEKDDALGKVALGKAQIQQLLLGGHMMSDGITRLLMQISDLKLTDKRPGAQQKINRIMHKRNDTAAQEAASGTSGPPLMLLTLTSESAGNQVCDISLASVYLCVDMGYLKELAEFFMPSDLVQTASSAAGAPETKQSQDSQPAQSQGARPSVASDGSPLSDDAEGSETGGSARGSIGMESSSSLLKMRVQMSEPQLLLVEDLSDPNCNAVVLNLKSSVDYRRNSSIEHCKIDVSKLQLFCCPFNEEKRQNSYIEVISPCDMSVVYHSEIDPNSANVPQKQKMAVICESIFVNISPPVIQTLVKISSVLTNAQALETADNDKPAEPKLYENGLWQVRPIESENLPFLSTDATSPDGTAMAEQGFDVGAALDEIEQRRKQEMQVTVSQIKLIFNIEVGPKTVPMLILESKVTGTMTNWSANSELTLTIDTEMAYYNEAHDYWEPFLEPVDLQPPRPFQLVFQFIVNEDFVLIDPDMETPVIQPKTVLSVTSVDPLELTLTRTSLAMLNTLSQEFNDAYNLGTRPRKEADAAFVIENCLGEPLMVCLSDQLTNKMRGTNTNSGGDPSSSSVKHPDSEVHLSPGDKLRLDERSRMVARNSVRELQEYEADPVRIGYRLPRLSMARQAVFHGTETRAFTAPLPSYPDPSGCPILLVSQARCYLGSKTLQVRSNVSLRNESALPVSVSTRSPDGSVAWSSSLDPVLPTEANQASSSHVCHLPLSQAAEARGHLYFSCYGQPSQPVAWYVEATHSLTFRHPEYPDLVTAFNVSVRVKYVYLESERDAKTASDYLLTIVPSYTIVNQLPINVHCQVPGNDEVKLIERGDSFDLYHVPASNTPTVNLLLSDYMERDWRGDLHLAKTADRPEDQIYGITFDSFMGVYDKLEMLLSIRLLDKQSTKNFTLFSTYWLVNKTGKELHYKTPDNRLWSHPANCNLTFMNLSANFSHKEKISLKVEESAWSSKFPLDTVGHAGTVKCKADSLSYQVGVNISVGSNGVTKIVTFIPFFSIVNKSPLRLEISECAPPVKGSSASLQNIASLANKGYVQVPCWDATPFWPVCDIEKKKMTMQIRVDEVEVTEPFPITDSCSSMLRLTGEAAKYGGVLAEVAFAQEACVVTLQQYQPGYAPLHLVNALPADKFPCVELRQVGVENSTLRLNSGSCVLYSWPDPKQDRVLEWSCGQFRATCRTVDSYEKGSPTGAKAEDSQPDALVYAVCFLSGCQRVLLFSNDVNLSCSARLATLFERIDYEFKVSLMSIGLSLVDNKQSREVAYISLRSPGVQWYETRKSGLLKPMKKGLSDSLEIIHNRYMQQVELKKNPQPRILERANDTEIEIDFSQQPFRLRKPKDCHVERQLDPALQFSFKSSPHNMTLAAKLARLQIDSMLPAGMYQIFFYQVPPPKSVAVDQVPKAFIDASIVIRRLENDVLQVQYCKVLVQEMEIKLDQVFLNGLLDMISVLVTPSVQETRQNFLTDCDFVEASLVSEQLANLSDSGKKHFIDQLHLSPIKINLSFSLSSADGNSNPFVSLAIATVLGSVARCSDVLFQLSCLHRENTAYSTAQLMAEVKRHYIRQFAGQLYKVFLSIDLIGNPLSVIGGLRSGAQDFFYEPIAGAIQGPEEFVEGVYSGMKSFVGHTVGGVSGFLQRMTGTVGHLAAIASFDSKYQRRREAHIRARANYGTGSNMAKAAQNLGLGFVQGISGIVTQPYEGGKEGGAVGFFSGVGKGLVGVVSRPVGAVVDFASDTFYTVQRVADLSEVPRRVRDPRYIRPDSRLVYYRRMEAAGYTILQQAVKPIPKEVYCLHCLVNDPKSRAPVAALVTNFRILLARRADLLATWSCDQQFTWNQVDDVRETRTGFELVLKSKKRKSILGGLRAPSNEVFSVHTSPDWARKIVTCIKQQIRDNEQRGSISSSDSPPTA
ncbi:hypothetical protein BOX15_Mlig010693g5 [Macrostomum lignano]|uniref:UBA domain-containing protein n=3 Tax=Macrostomum lignano TaxID=282301 RepID=A0A267FV54_9PLAT|nr:hypothetical protein BOX15_Mlig010693g5 [Macrostomum lignano]